MKDTYLFLIANGEVDGTDTLSQKGVKRIQFTATSVGIEERKIQKRSNPPVILSSRNISDLESVQILTESLGEERVTNLQFDTALPEENVTDQVLDALLSEIENVNRTYSIIFVILQPSVITKILNALVEYSADEREFEDTLSHGDFCVLEGQSDESYRIVTKERSPQTV